MSIARNGSSSTLNRSNGNDGAFARITSKESTTALAATDDSARIHQAVIPSIAEMLKSKASQNVGVWQRRMERQSRNSFGYIPTPDEAPQELKDATAQAAAFPSLHLDEQIEIAGPELAPFLDGKQKLGNDRVTLAEDFAYDEKDTLLGLKVQAAIVQAGIPGKIQMTDLAGGNAELLIEDQDVFMTGILSDRVISFSLADEEVDMNNLDESYDKGEWCHRSYSISVTDYLNDSGRSLRKQYDESHKIAMIHHLMATSELRSMHSVITDLNPDSRTVTVSDDNTEYTLNAKGETPELNSRSDDVIHHSMVPGFMDHIATKHGLTDGAALYSGLQNVFATAERNLIR